MNTISYIGDFSLAVTLLENAHAKDKHNITTGELLYYAYFRMVDAFLRFYCSAILKRCVTCRSNYLISTVLRSTLIGMLQMCY